MTPLPSTTREASEAIGKLCVAGDQACADGNFGELRQVAEQLTDYVPEPIHCELAALAAAARAEPDRAAVLWDALKNRLYREVRG